jgi:undecaprenol kinase
MDMELRDKQKKLGIIRFINSFKYSFDGLKYAYTHEQSMVVHIIITIFVIIAGVYFKISYMEWLLVLFLIGMIISMELMNTSIEATIDLVCPKYHPLAKIAKDTASASVFVLSVVAAAIGLIVFGPHLINLLF